ncbi:MAG: RNA polymerase sigma factor [Oscillospiraceae bacterium]|nr:RNA polymerase sigma factor [Oscillospiraceae bacterium]
MQKIYTKITDEYSATILNWAVKKTGNRTDGEDLAQEVLMQVFIAAAKHGRIEKLENFVWKTAHFTWCNHVRALARRNACELSEVLPDGTDFAQDYADGDALNAELARMRRKIANLNRLQRDAVILHYLDGLSVREVAARLNIAETAAAWHLFSARKKVKKELEAMRNENAYVYSPGKMRISASSGMSLSASGDVPQYPDTEKINDSLLRQNLCLLCRGDGKTLDELAELTGVSKPYLEHDLDWLVEREFLLMDGKRYQTSFVIMDQRYFEYRKEVYSTHRNSLIDKVTDYLWHNEPIIRGIGFHGSVFPAERLMWAIITMFISYASRNSELLLRLKSSDNRDIHMDGGKYFIMASDRTDGHVYDISGAYDNSGWENFYGIVCDTNGDNGFERYFWLGVYNFSCIEARPEIITGDAQVQALLYELYCGILKDGFSPDALSPDDKEKLAEAIECGLISKIDGLYSPNFVVFTKSQLAKLQNDVYAPLLALIGPVLDELASKFKKMHERDFPKARPGNINHHLYLDLWMFGVFALKFAAEDGKLSLPDAPADGTPLTLVLVN